MPWRERRDDFSVWEAELREDWPYSPYRLKQVMTDPVSAFLSVDGAYTRSHPLGRQFQVNSARWAWEIIAIPEAEKRERQAADGKRRRAENLIRWDCSSGSARPAFPHVLTVC